MLLAIDIGNTNINLGVFKGKQLKKRLIIPTGNKNYAPSLNRMFRSVKINDAIVCSVVPSALKAIKRDLKKLLGKSPYIVGENIFVPIKNLYRKPKQVGQDRLVNAYAGVLLYGKPLVAVDFGTAITFDAVSKKGEYLGGMILPGLQVSLDALNQRTALLPKIKLAAPREFIGKDTKNSMLSGIIYGISSLTDDLTARIKTRIGSKAKVIATGGNTGLIVKYCGGISRIDTVLTLKGLNFIYQRRRVK